MRLQGILVQSLRRNYEVAVGIVWGGCPQPDNGIFLPDAAVDILPFEVPQETTSCACTHVKTKMVGCLSPRSFPEIMNGALLEATLGSKRMHRSCTARLRGHLRRHASTSLSCSLRAIFRCILIGVLSFKQVFQLQCRSIPTEGLGMLVGVYVRYEYEPDE